jgi:hypothetical protein
MGVPLIPLICPQCGGQIRLPDTVNSCVCGNCGTQLRLKNESGAIYLERIVSTLGSLSAGVSRINSSIENISNKINQLHSKEFQSQITGAAEPIKTGFDWLHLFLSIGALVLVFVGTLLITGLFDASWGLFVFPIFLFMWHQFVCDLNYLPYYLWSLTNKIISGILFGLMALATYCKFFL